MRDQKGRFLKGEHWREPQLFRDKDWLTKEYSDNKRSTGEIAKQFNVTDGAIIFWLRKHKIKRRSVSEAREVKHWGASGKDNPMWNKRGELNPNWSGGITPERQEFYQSREWKEVCYFVWKRDKATCQRCNLQKEKGIEVEFHIHHIVSFKVKELRSDPENLVLLCETCHNFVHSKLNVNKSYIKIGEARLAQIR